MYTIKIKVNEKVYDKLISFLGKFTKQELEIIEEDAFFEENRNYLEKEINEIKSGIPTFFSIDEVDSSLEKVITKHENRI